MSIELPLMHRTHLRLVIRLLSSGVVPRFERSNSQVA
jgi:hypothetical protein